MVSLSVASIEGGVVDMVELEAAAQGKGREELDEDG
jgi:hypothetical protein